MTFLSKAFVLAYHAKLLELFGGGAGLRDEALLESALATPQATFDGAYLPADLWEMAAAYGFHLIKNHPFIDGNKRIAAVAIGTFLGVNGAPLRVSEPELYTTMIHLAEGTLTQPALAAWLRQHAPLQTRPS